MSFYAYYFIEYSVLHHIVNILLIRQQPPLWHGQSWCSQGEMNHLHAAARPSYIQLERRQSSDEYILYIKKFI